MTTTAPHPRLTDAPDRLFLPGRGLDLHDWCMTNKVSTPTLLDIENERARRGIKRKGKR